MECLRSSPQSKSSAASCSVAQLVFEKTKLLLSTSPGEAGKFAFEHVLVPSRKFTDVQQGPM